MLQRERCEHLDRFLLLLMEGEVEDERVEENLLKTEKGGAGKFVS